MKTIEERKQDFCHWASCDLHNEPIKMVIEFQEYWTEHSPNGKKMRWEKEPVFDMKRRFATWKRNSQKFAKPISKIEAAINAGQEAINYFKNQQ